MLDYPQDLKYTDSHEYVRVEGDTATIGITVFAVHELGEIVFVELPEIGALVNKDDEFGSVESVKAVETLYSPLSGTVVEVNGAVVDDPAIVNDDPYGEGWFLKVRVDDPTQLDEAMDAEQYMAMVTGDE